MFFVALLLLCLQASYGEDEAVFSQIVCENDRAQLDCTGGRTVRIVSAGYGRTVPDSQVCPFSRAQKDSTDCVMENSFWLVSMICNHRERCTFDVTNARMREDPCGGTYKYLNVSYTCETKGLRLAATCDDNMSVYVDGVEQVFSSVWWRPSFLNIPQGAVMVGIECSNNGGFGGIQVTFSDGEMTGSGDWKCSSEHMEGWNGADFDDSQWQPAVAREVPANRPSVIGMSSDAQWIWTNDTDKVREEKDSRVYCRYQIRADNYCNSFDADEAFSIQELLSVDPALAQVFMSACHFETRMMSSEAGIAARVAELEALFQKLVEVEERPEMIAEINQASSDSTVSSGSGSGKANFMEKLKEKVQKAGKKAKSVLDRLRERHH